MYKYLLAALYWIKLSGMNRIFVSFMIILGVGRTYKWAGG